MKAFCLLPMLFIVAGCTVTWPWQKSREELNAEIKRLDTRLDDNSKLLTATQELIDKQKAEVAALQNVDHSKDDCSQVVAEHVNNIVTVSTILPPQSRKDEVILDEAQAAATGLPHAKENNLELMRKLLDEKDTTINELNLHYQKAQEDIQQLNKNVADAKKLAEQTKQEVDKKATQVNELTTTIQEKDKDLNDAKSGWQKAKNFIASIRDWLAGIFIFISIAIGVLGWFTGKFITVAKAAVGLVVSVLLLLVPADYYMIGLLVGLGALIVYALIHHLTVYRTLNAAKELETKVADASIGTFHEVKSMIEEPELKKKVEEIEDEWRRDVDGMDNIIKSRLEKLNLVAKK